MIQFGIYRLSFIFPAATILCLFLVFFQKELFKLNLNNFKVIGCLYTFLIFYSVLASFIQQSLEPLLVYGFFTLATLLCVLIPTYRKFNLRYFLNGFLVFCLVICLLSFILGISVFRFSGVFDNPNGMGRFASIIFGVYLLYFLHTDKKNKFIRFILIVSIFIFLCFLLFSNSRASLLSSLIPLIILSAVYFYKSFSKNFRFFSKKALLYIFMTTIFASISLFTLFRLGAFDELINKIYLTYTLGNITQDRSLRWDKAFDYVSFFGAGSQIYESSGLSEVHNNYLGQALLFGSIGSFLFFTPLFYILFKSFSKTISSSTLASQLCFFCSCYFLIYSTVETGAAIFVVWLTFISYSIMRKDI